MEIKKFISGLTYCATNKKQEGAGWQWLMIIESGPQLFLTKLSFYCTANRSRKFSFQKLLLQVVNGTDIPRLLSAEAFVCAHDKCCVISECSTEKLSRFVFV